MSPEPGPKPMKPGFLAPPGPKRPFRISKKLTVTIVAAVLLFANKTFALGIDDETMTRLVGLAAAYVIGQGVADTRRSGGMMIP